MSKLLLLQYILTVYITWFLLDSFSLILILSLYVLPSWYSFLICSILLILLTVICEIWSVSLFQMLFCCKIFLGYHCRFFIAGFNFISYYYFLVHTESGCSCDHSSALFITFFWVSTNLIFIYYFLILIHFGCLTD